MPTNAQLTITLLRIGEANHAPLPPPPRIGSPPPSKPASLNDESLRATGSEPPLNATRSELDAAISHDPDTKHESPPDVAAAKSTSHGKKGSRILNFFRGTTAGAVHTAIGTDTVRAAAGSKHAKARKGVVPSSNSAPISGPVEFEARYDGKKGHVYLSTAASAPVVAFGAKETQEDIGAQKRDDLHPLWSVAVGDIVEVKKIGGYGWKAKLVVGWSLDKEVKDGLEIVTAEGQTYRVTAVPLRDELFNRLVAMGAQKWEAW